MVNVEFVVVAVVVLEAVLLNAPLHLILTQRTQETNEALKL